MPTVSRSATVLGKVPPGNRLQSMHLEEAQIDRHQVDGDFAPDGVSHRARRLIVTRGLIRSTRDAAHSTDRRELLFERSLARRIDPEHVILVQLRHVLQDERSLPRDRRSDDDQSYQDAELNEPRAPGEPSMTRRRTAVPHPGVTPEALDPAQVLEPDTPLPGQQSALADLLVSWRELNSARDNRVDVVSLGNPHFSLSEFARLAQLCRDRVKHPDAVLVITCGRAVLEQARDAGYIDVIENFGAPW